MCFWLSVHQTKTQISLPISLSPLFWRERKNKTQIRINHPKSLRSISSPFIHSFIRVGSWICLRFLFVSIKFSLDPFGKFLFFSIFFLIIILLPNYGSAILFYFEIFFLGGGVGGLDQVLLVIVAYVNSHFCRSVLSSLISYKASFFFFFLGLAEENPSRVSFANF